MTDSIKSGKKGISIRVIHVAMIVCALITAILLVFTTMQTSKMFNRLNRETGNYIVRQKAAHDLMEASDYLTEMVQRFTLEGDTQYLDNYFEEAFVSKRREASVVTMSENEAEQSLIQGIQEALNESQSLMIREYYAMKLVLEAKEIRDYPETLRAIELTEADMFLSADEKMEKAQSMVLGTEYYASKEVIRNKLKNSLNQMDSMMASARQETTAEVERELKLIRGAIIGLTVVLLILIGLTAMMATIPMIRASEDIRNRKPIRSSGAKEFRRLAKSYNELYEEIYQPEEKTEQ